nr:TetR family transcriptional regulator [Streptomyces sp. MUM 16J]
MSTTPRASQGTAHRSFSAAAPASLTERRKAETRMEIARAAAALFAHRGLRATRAEDIARAAGIAPRTFYRYFATKEEAVAPLYAAGAQRWAEAVRAAPASLTVPEALEHAVHHTLTPGSGVSAASWEWARTLIRLAETSPALRKVWAEVCQTSEGALAEILAARLSSPGAVGAAGAAGAGGVAGSSGGVGTTGSSGAAGPAEPAGEGADNVASPSEAPTSDPSATPVLAPAAITPHLRFAAAVAGAAVRVAVECWAAATSAPVGPDGPAALALRNLRALRAFEWSGEN